MIEGLSPRSSLPPLQHERHRLVHVNRSELDLRMGLRLDAEDLVHEPLPDALDAAEVQHDLAEPLQAVE